MLGTGGYAVLILVAVVLTAGIGQVLYRSGRPFLQDVFQSAETARSINLLLTVLFHLLTLGVLALLLVAGPVGGISTFQTVVLNLGITLLVVGVAYGVSMLVLLRTRERRRQIAVSAEINQQLTERRWGRTTGRERPVGTPSPAPPAPSDRPED